MIRTHLPCHMAGALLLCALGATAITCRDVPSAPAGTGGAVSLAAVIGDTIPSYYPLPEAKGGWRKKTNAAFLASLGIDSVKLADFGAYNMSVSSTDGMTGAIVIKGGWIVGEWYSSTKAKTYLYHIASNGKSISTLLFGTFGIPNTAKLYDKKWLPEAYPLSDPGKAAITFDHVFRHTSGIIPESSGDLEAKNDWNHVTSAFNYKPYTLGRDTDYPRSARLWFAPGTPQQPWGYLTTGYSSVAFNHFAFIFQNLTGLDAFTVLRQRIFDPIGIGNVIVKRRDGYWFTAGGLRVAARDYARIAYLMLRRGRWGSRQIFPSAFLDHFTSAPYYPNIRTNHDGFYGSQYPAELYSIRASGLNWAFVLASKDLIAIRVGRTSNTRYADVQSRFLAKLFAALTAPATTKR